MKYQDLISKLTLEEKVALTSGKDFWTTVGVDRDGVNQVSVTATYNGVAGKTVTETITMTVSW